MLENTEEIYLARDSEGNSVLAFDLDSAVASIAEYENSGPIRVVCLSVTMALPVEGDDEDHVETITVDVPPQPVAADHGDEEELPELPAEAGSEPTIGVEGDHGNPATQKPEQEAVAA